MRFVVLLMLVCVALGQKSPSPRRQRLSRLQSNTCLSEVVALIKESHCKPIKQPVRVPVPPGYSAVRPLVVMLMRCGGLACHHSGLDCLPRQDLVKNISIPVYVYNQESKRQCSQVQMEIHEGCECGCNKICPENQVLREDTCECECDREQQEKCEGRRRLWDSSSCSCHCPFTTTTQCSTGQVFIPELCRCESY